MNGIANGENRSRRLFIGGVVLLLLYLTLDLIVREGLFQTLDMDMFMIVNSMRPPIWVDSIMVAFSLYGREVVWGVLTVTFFFFGGEREKKVALTLGLLFLLLIGTGYIGKVFNSRLRPYDAIEGVRLLVPKEVGYSFPSGHTIIVAGGVVVTSLKLKRWLSVLLIFEAVCVAFSRVYVGVHYPMDIIGGAFLGVGLALIFCSNIRVINEVFERLPRGLRQSRQFITAC